MQDTTLDFMWGVEKEGDSKRSRRGEDKDTWGETHKFMTEEVPPILTLLEDDLREILGTHEAAQPAAGQH